MTDISNGQTPNNDVKTTAPIWSPFTAMRNNTLSKVWLWFLACECRFLIIIAEITSTGIQMPNTTPDMPNCVWTGLNSVNHSTVFEWTDGSTVDYFDWADQRPTVRATAETYVVFYPDYFQDSSLNAGFYNRWNNCPPNYNARVSVCKMPANS